MGIDILDARRKLYLAIGVLMYATLGVDAALVHEWRLNDSFYVWKPVPGNEVPPRKGMWPIEPMPGWDSLARPQTRQVRYHQGPVITVLVWTVISSVYLIGFYFAPVSPILQLEVIALAALALQGLVSMGYLTSYIDVFVGPTRVHNVQVRGPVTLVLGWTAVALIGALLALEVVYVRRALRTHKPDEVWGRRLIDVVEQAAQGQDADERIPLIPERDTTPSPAVCSPWALRLVAYILLAAAAAGTVRLDAMIVHSFRINGGYDETPTWGPPEPGSSLPPPQHTHKPGRAPEYTIMGPILVLVFAALTTVFALVRPALRISIRTEAVVTGVLFAAGIGAMATLSTYWHIFNPYHARSFKLTGIATLVLGWFATGTLLFLLVLEILVVLRSTTEGAEDVWNTKFVDLVKDKSLWWVYVPTESASGYTPLETSADEAENEG